MNSGYTFPETAVVTGTSENNLYFLSNTIGTVKTYYIKGYDGVPFVSVRNTVPVFLRLIVNAGGNSNLTASQITVTVDDLKAVITRGDKAESLTFNAFNQTVSSDTFMDFCTLDKVYNNCSLLAGERENFCKVKNASAAGTASVAFNIDTPYGLKMYPYTDSDGKKDILIPAQLAGLILCSPNAVLLSSFNGKNYYINTSAGIMSGAEWDSYKTGYGRTRTRTRAEAEFNYRLLCMLFDKFYCLQHLRTADMNYGFNTFCFNYGLEQRLLSSNPDVYDTAVVEALMRYIDDGHTNYFFPSYYQDVSEIPYFQNLVQKYAGSRYTKLLKLRSDLKAARNEKDGYSGGLRIINEPDTDTPAIAVITFDGFINSSDSYVSKRSDIISAKPENLAGTDSFELFYNALYTIQHTYPGIKNIIIDDSINGGGAVDTAVYLANIFIKNAGFHYRNQLDGSVNTAVYDVDTDLNGSAADVDSSWDLSKYHVYVLTSEFSFSCGNLFPSIMSDQRGTGAKNVASINLIGQTSGGGAGAVMVSGTGDGAGIRTSSCFELIYSNGDSVDAGVAPDLTLDHSVYYDDTEMYKALKAEYGANF